MLQIYTDSLLYKIEAETFMKASKSIKSYLTSVITQKIENTIIIQIN